MDGVKEEEGIKSGNRREESKHKPPIHRCEPAAKAGLYH